MTAGRAIAVGLALLGAACGGDPTGIEPAAGAPTFAAGGGARTLDAAIVGGWSRIVLTELPAGLTASETRWTFRADGVVERRLVTTNLTLGLADQIVATGTWRTAGDGTVTIALDGPTGATLRLEYAIEPRIDGAVLVLGGQRYERLRS